MTKICVVNVANGNWYPLGQRRLAKSLQNHNYRGDFLFWNNSYPENCPTHAETPYAFKTYALNVAREKGYEVVLWLDSSMIAIRSLDFILKQIEEHGYFLPVEQHKVGEWSTDACLERNNCSRDEAMSINTILCGCIGLDFRNEKARIFLDRWHERACDGISFVGPWDNHNLSASKDPRCRGHRHDIPSASIIAYKENMKVYRWAGEVVPEFGRSKLYDVSTFWCKRSCQSEEI